MGVSPLTPSAALPLSNSTSSSVVLGEALREKCKLHHHAVVLLLEPSSSTSPSSLLDQGVGDVTGLHVC